MSKFLLNFFVQIFKTLIYSKIKFYSKKKFRRFRPIRPFDSPWPTRFFLLSNRPLPLFPLGLGLSADPSRPLGPADRALVAPCRIIASHTRRRLQLRRLCPLHAWLISGPHLSSLTSGSVELGRTATTSRRSPRCPAPHLGCRPSRYSPRHHSPP
jgi:hypothetical protein